MNIIYIGGKMGNAMNWLAGGSWAPTSNAAAENAAAEAKKQSQLLEAQQDQLNSQKKAETAALNAKKVKSLNLLSGGSMLANSGNNQLSSLLG